MEYKRKKIILEPQEIDKHNWFYDGKKYLELVHEVFNKNGNYIQTDVIKLEISKLADFISNMQ